MIYKYNRKTGDFIKVSLSNPNGYIPDGYTDIVPPSFDENNEWCVFDGANWNVYPKEFKTVWNKENGNPETIRSYLSPPYYATDVEPTIDSYYEIYFDGSNWQIDVDKTSDKYKINFNPSDDFHTYTHLASYQKDVLATSLGITRSALDYQINTRIREMSVIAIRNALNDNGHFVGFEPSYMWQRNQSNDTYFTMINNVNVNSDWTLASNIDLNHKSFELYMRVKVKQSGANGWYFVKGNGNNTRNTTLHIGMRDSDTFTVAFYGNDVDWDFNPTINQYYDIRIRHNTNSQDSELWIDDEYFGVRHHSRGQYEGNIGRFCYNVNNVDVKDKIELNTFALKVE